MNPITLPIAELKPALAGLGKVINPRASLAILGHVKVERTSEGWIALTGTDLDRFVTMRLEHPAEGSPTSVLLPFDQLLQITKNCGKGESLEIESTPEANVIRFPLGDTLGESKVAFVAPDEFPATPKIKSDAMPLPASLRASIQEAMDCSSTDATRYVINSAFIDASNAKASYVVGTDGKHLYSANSFVLPLKNSVIIPSHKFIGWKEFNADGEWQMKADQTHVQLSTRRWRFISKQTDATYPNWRQVVPDPSGDQTIITIDPSALDSLIQTIGRMPCHDDQRHHTIGIEWHLGQLRLLGKSHADEPWTRVVIPAAKGQGNDIEILCDRRYLIKAFGFGLNTMGLANELSPLRFSNGGRQMIVMPLRPCGDTTQAPSSPSAPNPETSTSSTPPAADQPHPQTPSTATMQTHTANGKPHPAATDGSTTATTTNSHTPPASKDESKPALESALVQVESIKTSFRETINGLTKLGDTIRNAMREQKASEKEVHNVRQTLRSLQGVRL